MKNQKQEFVRVRDGVRHPRLGSIDGWVGIILRSFAVRGDTFLDLELTSDSIGKLSLEKKQSLFEARIIFTRVRIAANNTERINLSESDSARLSAIRNIQAEWYVDVGSRQLDPTAFAAERAYKEEGGEEVDESRRKLIKGAVFAGLALLLMYKQCNDDDNDNRSGSSWGRGYHYS